MRRYLLPLAVTALLAGCQELEVVNPNEPDRERVLSRPDDVESLIASSFRLWYTTPQNEYPNIPFAAMADNITGGFFDYGVYDVSLEPRVAWNNSSLNTRDGTNRLPWYNTYRALSTVNDGLFALDNGVDLDGGTAGTRTLRARAFAKFVQGLSHGYIGLIFDKAYVVTEHTDLETFDQTAFEPYEVLRDTAIGELDEAIRLAGQGTFTIPADLMWVNGVEISNQRLAQLANTYAARFMVYSARTPAERAAVDWNEVLRRIDAGITTDFNPHGALEVLEGNFRRLLARVRTNPGDHIRPDMMALGPADTSGGFQTWYATPSANRMPWQMRTPDRRIQGAASATAAGKYVAYSRLSIWAAARGTYRFSWYYYLRSGAGDSWYVGPQLTLLRSEMDLLKAEALIRLGRAAEAVPLINNTRVANGQLPPVTVDGPPDNGACVPRKFNGACGSLWDALRHEKTLELMGVEGGVSWWDGRGWGALQEGTPIHMPIPGRELDNLGLANYTFGGNAGGGAPPPDPERCPVPLARCPA